jgi:hypothetical protein
LDKESVRGFVGVILVPRGKKLAGFVRRFRPGALLEGHSPQKAWHSCETKVAGGIWRAIGTMCNKSLCWSLWMLGQISLVTGPRNCYTWEVRNLYRQ